jgi:hypothetical protein
LTWQELGAVILSAELRQLNRARSNRLQFFTIVAAFSLSPSNRYHLSLLSLKWAIKSSFSSVDSSRAQKGTANAAALLVWRKGARSGKDAAAATGKFDARSSYSYVYCM